MAIAVRITLKEIEITQKDNLHLTLHLSGKDELNTSSYRIKPLNSKAMLSNENSKNLALMNVRYLTRIYSKISFCA
ncbi:hypothetical protein ACJJIX_12015 [Microbulbifer sp. VAAC004]|uniref:hypothetical protein n=1 Tax=unclassified Microbulbifer TaxID=2619833 RepID=UPI00403AF1AD